MKTKSILTIACLMILAAPAFANAFGRRTLKDAEASLCKEDPALCDLVTSKEELNPYIVDLSIEYSPTDAPDKRLATIEEVANQAADITGRQKLQLSIIKRHDPDWRVVDAIIKIELSPPSYFKSLVRDKVNSLFSEAAKAKLFWLPFINGERNRLMKAAESNAILRRTIEDLHLYEKNKAAKTLLAEIGNPNVERVLAPHAEARAFIPQDRARETGWWPYTGKRCEMLLNQK